MVPHIVHTVSKMSPTKLLKLTDDRQRERERAGKTHEREEREERERPKVEVVEEIRRGADSSSVSES